MTPQKVLLISLGGAGDTLMATPLLGAVRAAFPRSEIDVLTMQGAVAGGVLKGNRAVTRHLHHEFMKCSWFSSLRFCAGLRRHRYDVSFTVMPQNRLEYNVVTWLIRARLRIGFRFGQSCGALPGLFLTDTVDEDESAHLVDNNLRLLTEGLGVAVPDEGDRHLTLVLDPENDAAADAFIAAAGLEGAPLTGLHPGSGSTKNLALRRWPPEQWAAVLKLLAVEPERRFLLFGGPDEASLRDAIREQSGLGPDRLVDVQLDDIRDVAALLGRMQSFLCCDTLLTHIAAARAVPTVVVMGPTPHTSVRPYACPHRIVRLGLVCSPCYRYSRHGIRCTNPQFLKCLQDISPEQVKSAVEELMHDASCGC